ncbi:MAG: serine/threonine protein phosphatase [Deltaproteobacteria bacterium]|nr:serine/threonine protein phosphatase [Deltaproteobacteria bacterium]
MSTKRTIVIGDIHGCYDETVELLTQLAVTSSDRVIFAGDLVDRGPQPRECVELAMKHECVLGNHEEKHLQIRDSLLWKLSPSHSFTRNALGPEHYAYFAQLPLFIRLPEFEAAVVHAGAFPGVPLEQQTPRHLMHIQNIKPPATKTYWPSKAPADHRFWAHFWTGPERLIFGHSVLDRPLVTRWAVGIDTGAVFGHGLTALVLPDWKLVTIPTRAHNDGRSRVAQIEIMDGVKAWS